MGDGVESWMSRNNNILSLFSFENVNVFLDCLKVPHLVICKKICLIYA